MGTLTIRKLDDRVKSKLRVRAAQHGRSMEEEARQIITSALNARSRKNPPGNIADLIRSVFGPLGGVELPELPKEFVGPPRVRP